MVLKLEEDAGRLIALHLLKRSTGNFRDRANTRYEELREDIGKRLKERPKDKMSISTEFLSVRLVWDDNVGITGARKINLAIAEFKQKYPEYGEKLQELIDEHRSGRRAYLLFGGQVSDEVYIGIVQDIIKGDYERSKEVYQAVRVIDANLERRKGKEGEFEKSLLSE